MTSPNLVITSILVISCILFAESKIIYENYKVFGLTPTTEKDLHSLQYYENIKGYNYWSLNERVGLESDLMVEPSAQETFLSEIGNSTISLRTKIENVQHAINDQTVTRLARNSDFTWDSFHNLDDIYSWFEYLAETYPEAEIVDGGDSFENRDILGIKIDFGKAVDSAVIEGGIHAREWLSPATVTYIIYEFLTSTDPEIRHLAELFEWHIFPVTNPDGYAYTFSTDRMWRKSRRPYSTDCAVEGTGVGADLNRNYDYFWNEIGASSDPCSNTFAGPSPFSEVEALTFSQYVSNVENLKLYLAFHTYTQLVLIPYSHTEEYVENYSNVFEACIRASDKLSQRYGTVYSVGHSTALMYSMSGTSYDWVKGTHPQVNISLLLEMRDLGEYGFLVPPSLIMPNNLEIMDFLTGLVENSQQLGYFQQPLSDSAVFSSSNLIMNLFTIILSYVLGVYYLQ